MRYCLYNRHALRQRATTWACIQELILRNTRYIFRGTVYWPEKLWNTFSNFVYFVNSGYALWRVCAPLWLVHCSVSQEIVATTFAYAQIVAKSCTPRYLHRPTPPNPSASTTPRSSGGAAWREGGDGVTERLLPPWRASRDRAIAFAGYVYFFFDWIA